MCGSRGDRPAECEGGGDCAKRVLVTKLRPRILSNGFFIRGKGAWKKNSGQEIARGWGYLMGGVTAAMLKKIRMSKSDFVVKRGISC